MKINKNTVMKINKNTVMKINKNTVPCTWGNFKLEYLPE